MPALSLNDLEIFGKPQTSLRHGFFSFKRRNLDKMIYKLLPSLRRVVAIDRPLNYFRIVVKE